MRVVVQYAGHPKSPAILWRQFLHEREGVLDECAQQRKIAQVAKQISWQPAGGCLTDQRRQRRRPWVAPRWVVGFEV